MPMGPMQMQNPQMGYGWVPGNGMNPAQQPYPMVPGERPRCEFDYLGPYDCWYMSSAWSVVFLSQCRVFEHPVGRGCRRKGLAGWRSARGAPQMLMFLLWKSPGQCQRSLGFRKECPRSLTDVHCMTEVNTCVLGLTEGPAGLCMGRNSMHMWAPCLRLLDSAVRFAPPPRIGGNDWIDSHQPKVCWADVQVSR